MGPATPGRTAIDSFRGPDDAARQDSAQVPSRPPTARMRPGGARSHRPEEFSPAMLDIHRARRSLLLTVAACAVVAGCAADPQGNPSGRPDHPRAGGVLHLAQIEPSTLDPATVYDSYDAAVVNQIHAGLLRHDRNFSVRPDVATSWTIDHDGLEYRFELRRGVRFHDGTPLTAADVVHSVERVFRIDPESTILARQYLGVIAGTDAFARGEADSIEGLEILGPHALAIRLERPYAPFLNVLASEFARILPRPESGGDPVDGSVGCGPFALRSWTPGERLVLDRFTDYHGPGAHLDGLVIETPPPPVLPRAIRGFIEGDVHVVELTNTAIEAVAAVRDARVHQRRELSLTFLAFAVDRPPFDDPDVRRAVAHAIDVASLSGIDEHRRPAATGVLPPGFPGYEPLDKCLSFAPARAASLLAAAGHPRGGGLPRVTIAIPRRGEGFETLALDLCHQIEASGLDVEPLLVDWNDFDRGLRSNAYHAFLLTWMPDLPDADSFFYPLFHTGGSVNHLHYSDTELDAWLDTARVELDRTRRTRLYRRAEQRVLEDAAIVPLHFNSTVFAARPSVQDFQVTSMGGANLPLRSVWLDPSAGRGAR